MIIGYSKQDGDVILIFRKNEHLIQIDFDRPLKLGGACLVSDCCNKHLYGFNFCAEHKWIMPVPAERCAFGFQVALIKYWEELGNKIIRNCIYVGENKESKKLLNFSFRMCLSNIRKKGVLMING